MNRRVMLAFGAVALLAACLILYLALNTDDTPSASADTGATGDTPTAPDDKQAATPRPQLPGSGSNQVTTREYFNKEGIRVRDHRKQIPEAHEPLPKKEPPPDGRKIDPKITQALSVKLQEVVAACAGTIPKEARNKKSRLEGVVTVGIKDHQVTVNESVVQLRNLDTDVAPIKKCIEEKAIGIGAQAPGEADLDRYQITLSFTLARARATPPTSPPK